MSDLGAATWSETDASNTATPPNGWPEGMFPSDVNNSARANMGGEKRWWVRSNSVFTTAGSSTVYTLTYGQAAAAYYDGEEFSFLLDETCGAAPTLNIDGLGARNLRKFVSGAWVNLAAGDLVALQPVRVRYNLADTTFDVISAPPQNIGQMVFTETGAEAHGTGTIPVDDTIPQNTEGTEFMTCTITPVSATSKLLIDVVWNGVVDLSVAPFTVALFQDSTANALAAVYATSTASGNPMNVKFTHIMTSGTTSATTFKVRAGAASASTTVFNGDNAPNRVYGGVMASSISIREVP